MVFSLLVVIAVSTYRNISRDRERAEDSILREGLVVIRAIEAGMRADLPERRPEISRVQKIVEEASREPSVTNIFLFDGRGNILASSPTGGKHGKIEDVCFLSLLPREKGIITRYPQVLGGEQERVAIAAAVNNP